MPKYIKIFFYILQMSNDCICKMASAKLALSSILRKDQDPEYSRILKLVDEYLLRNCDHEIVKDLIDLDPDRSKTITYCSKCYTTF